MSLIFFFLKSVDLPVRRQKLFSQDECRLEFAERNENSITMETAYVLLELLMMTSTSPSNYFTSFLLYLLLLSFHISMKRIQRRQ